MAIPMPSFRARRRVVRPVLALVATLAALGASCGGRELDPAALAMPTTPPDVLRDFLKSRREPASEPDPRLRPRDIVRIEVEDVAEVTRSYEVSSKGSIRVPLIGAIEAAGKRARQLETEVARRLSSMVVRPEVEVKLLESPDRTAVVTGAVEKPGPVRLATEGTTLLEALTAAGGLAVDAGKIVRIVPPTAPVPGLFAEPVADSSDGAIEIAVADLLRSGETGALWFYLQPGDLVEVPSVTDLAVARSRAARESAAVHGD